jgi:hypothetical protein
MTTSDGKVRLTPHKIAVSNVTATAHGAAHPDGEYYLKREVDALLAERDATVARLEHDAARYRWLKDNAWKPRSKNPELSLGWYMEFKFMAGDFVPGGGIDLDTAVDDARAALALGERQQEGT